MHKHRRQHPNWEERWRYLDFSYSLTSTREGGLFQFGHSSRLHAWHACMACIHGMHEGISASVSAYSGASWVTGDRLDGNSGLHTGSACVGESCRAGTNHIRRNILEVSTLSWLRSLKKGAVSGEFQNSFFRTPANPGWVCIRTAKCHRKPNPAARKQVESRPPLIAQAPDSRDAPAAHEVLSGVHGLPVLVISGAVGQSASRVNGIYELRS